MAATGWTYYCPFHPDADTALQQLRHDVFARRAYSLPADLLGQADDQTLNRVAPPIADMKRMLKISKALDQAMAEFGADTEYAAKQANGVEAFIKNVEKKGFASAARATLGSADSQDPASIDEALEIAGESGTHSILDIDRVSDTPGFGVATPLSDQELLDLFGTIEPSLEMAQLAERDGKLFAFRDRWEAAFFPIFAEGKPNQYVFAGSSGD